MHNVKDVSLHERYELLDLNRDIGVKTFEAREIATGRPVKVHLFVQPLAPLQAELLKALDKLPDDQKKRIIERGKHEGTPYVVTDRLVDYAGLSEWLLAEGHSAPAPPPASQPVPTPASPSSANSELNQKFTELFPTAERPNLAGSLQKSPPQRASNLAASLRSPDPPPPAAAPPAQAQAEPGEFTRMFQSPVAAPSRAALPSLQPAAVPPVQAPPTAPAPPSKTPPPAAKEEGEFTRMFQPPAGVGATPVPTPIPAVAPQHEPGEFTRMFHLPAVKGSPSAAARPPAAQLPSSAPQAATQSQPPAGPQSGGSGEHTRQFSAPAKVTFGQNSKAPSVPGASPSARVVPLAMAQPDKQNMAPDPAPARRSNLPLILGIVGILLVAALLILFFAMRPK